MFGAEIAETGDIHLATGIQRNSNDPFTICDIFKKIENSGAMIAPKDQWKRLHRNLRMVTEAFLERPDEE